MPGNADNTVSNLDGAHVHQNDKTDDPAHLVLQARAGDASVVSIDSPQGSNLVSSAGDQNRVHDNVHDDQHSVQQARAGGNLVVDVQNAHGSNIVVISETGDHVHLNTMHDGWVV
jgi:hypothetical protein